MMACQLNDICTVLKIFGIIPPNLYFVSFVILSEIYQILIAIQGLNNIKLIVTNVCINYMYIEGKL